MHRPLCFLLLLGLVGCSSPEVEPAPETSTEPLAAPKGPPHGAGDNAAMERLAKTDPVAFLEKSHQRYDREVRCYRTTLVKREFITPTKGKGKLLPEEHIDAWFREKPYSVRMSWVKGAGLASRTLYVQGENKNQLLARPTGLGALFGIWRRDTDSDEAKQSSRYPITEFGIKAGSQNTLRAWKAARKRGELKVDFLGEAAPPELNGRACWKLHRTAGTPEDGGILDGTFYYDKENWLQIGSVLEGEGGRLIASYFFRDLKLNAELPPDIFTERGLRK
jgi:hypothetical protein